MTDTTRAMRRVRWSFDDGPTYDGYHDGTYWNGFANIYCEPDVARRVLADLEAEYATFPDADPDALDDVRHLIANPDPNGLVCFAYGYTAQIEGE